MSAPALQCVEPTRALGLLAEASQPAAQGMPRPDFVCLLLQIGLLYLRYVGEPKSLWQDWLSHYMYDDQVRQSESLGAC